MAPLSRARPCSEHWGCDRWLKLSLVKLIVGSIRSYLKHCGHTMPQDIVKALAAMCDATIKSR